jgi:hypothetical protein
MKKREENLLAKIANLLGKEVEEVKEAKAVYTEEEQMYEAQSVLNFFAWRKSLIRGLKESDAQWEARNRVWKYKVCEECKERFAYSLHYDGVKFCSLDCLKSALRKEGIEFNPYRPLSKRYGFHQRPGIVPSSALKSLEVAFAASSSEQPESASSDLPKSLVPDLVSTDCQDQ